MGFDPTKLSKKFRDCIEKREPVTVEVPEMREQNLLLQTDAPIYKLVLPIPPSVNDYWASRVIVPRNPENKPFINTFLTADAKAFKERVAAIMVEAGIPTLRGPVALKIEVYRPRKIGDLDNYMKALLDSLKGSAYVDDGQVVRIIAERFDDKGSPRVEVFITERV